MVLKLTFRIGVPAVLSGHSFAAAVAAPAARSGPDRVEIDFDLSSYTKVYLVIYDSGSVPDQSIFYLPLEIARHPILKVTCKHFALPLEPF